MESFKANYSPNVAEILFELNSSIALSTYQAGRLIFIGAKDRYRLSQTPRFFKKPMGIYYNDDKLLLGSFSEVSVFRNIPELAEQYNEAEGGTEYSDVFFERARYFTGNLDLHDLVDTKAGIIGVNTRFSCISKVNEDYNFTPIWKPGFIDKLTGGDQCHLNGMAMKDGAPVYTTALGKTTNPNGWKQHRNHGGILMEIKKNEVIADGLSMPHSPRIVDNELYILQSGKGELCRVNTATGEVETVLKVPRFLRGLDYFGGYFFIGYSKIRKTSKDFQQLEISDTSNTSGILVVFKGTFSVVGKIEYADTVEEIYDIAVLKGLKHASIAKPEKNYHLNAICAKSFYFWQNPKKLKDAK